MRLVRGQSQIQNTHVSLLSQMKWMSKPYTLINGFKACGLFRWNPNEINFSKCLGKNQKKELEDICGSELVIKFINIENVLYENHPLDFYILCKIWESFAASTSSGTERKTE